MNTYRIGILNLLFNRVITADCPNGSQMSFQDPATDYMEDLLDLNRHFFLLIVAIVLFVGWILTITLKMYNSTVSSRKLKFHHSLILELIWILTPLLALNLLFTPSSALLKSSLIICDNDVQVKVYGHQWYWEYEVTESVLCKTDYSPVFASYHLSDEFACLDNNGLKRNLEADRRIIFPGNTQIKLMVTGCDVLHSWTIPSFGVKIDACPGRLNTMYLFLKREGLFFGQCSEICGVNHGFMPITAVVVSTDCFRCMLTTRLNNFLHGF